MPALRCGDEPGASTMSNLSRSEATGSYCEYAGHEWVDAGGGLVICAVCQAEDFRDLDPAGFDIGEAQDMLSDQYGGHR